VPQSSANGANDAAVLGSDGATSGSSGVMSGHVTVALPETGA
jgi:hypothetical protein